MREWVLLHNPASREGARALAKVRALLETMDSPARERIRFLSIRDLGSLREMPERMVLLGGDGTNNAAAEWLVRAGGDCPLALVPAGTGNNLARGLGIPLRKDEALRLALVGKETRPLDVFAYRAGAEDRTRYIVQTSALGFPAAMAARYDALRKKPMLRFLFRPAGTYVYRIIGLLGLAGQKIREKRGKDLLRVRLELPGETMEEAVLAVFVGNDTSLGGNFHPCPRAKVDDGLLDICMVRAGTGAPYLKIFGRIIRGQHLSEERTVVYRQSPGPALMRLSLPSQFLVDGDLWACSDRYELKVLPSRLKIVCG